MGRWGWHPMASDSAMDFRDDFESFVFDCDDYYEFDNYQDQLKVKLEEITVEKLKEYFEKSEVASSYTRFGDCYYVLPYEFAKYKVKVKEDVKEYLRDLLITSIKRIAIEDEDYILTNLLKYNITKKSNLYFLYSQQVFLAHFDEVFDLKFNLDEDSGLLNTMSETSKKDNYDDFLNSVQLFEGWHGTLFELLKNKGKDKKTISFIKELANNGDLAAKDQVISHIDIFKDDVDFLIECFHDIVLFGYNNLDDYEYGCSLNETLDCALVWNRYSDHFIENHYMEEILEKYDGDSLTTMKNILEICSISERLFKPQFDEFYKEMGEEAYDTILYNAIENLYTIGSHVFLKLYQNNFLGEITEVMRYIFDNHSEFTVIKDIENHLFDDPDGILECLYESLVFIWCYVGQDEEKFNREIEWIIKKEKDIMELFGVRYEDAFASFFDYSDEFELEKYPYNQYEYTIEVLENYLDTANNKDKVNHVIDVLKKIIGIIKTYSQE